jgi:hypothetical protein
MPAGTKKRKLSPEQHTKIKRMAERMADSAFKGQKGRGDRKSQIFAIAINRVKKQGS